MKVLGAVVLAFLFSSSAAFAQTTPVGDWDAVFVGPTATRPQMVSHITFTIRPAPNGFVGTARTEPEWPGVLEVSDLTFEGDRLTFTGMGSAGSSVTIGGLTTTNGCPKLLFDGTIQGDEMNLRLIWVSTKFSDTAGKPQILMKATRESKEPSPFVPTHVAGDCS